MPSAPAKSGQVIILFGWSKNIGFATNYLRLKENFADKCTIIETGLTNLNKLRKRGVADRLLRGS